MGYFKYIQKEEGGVISFDRTFIKDEADYNYDLEVIRILDQIADEELAKIEVDRLLFLADITADSPEKEAYLLTFTEKETKINDKKTERAAKKVTIEADKEKVKVKDN